jgi:hypothetical protein
MFLYAGKGRETNKKLHSNTHSSWEVKQNKKHIDDDEEENEEKKHINK